MEEEQFVFIEFLGLPDPSVLRQKGICTMLAIDSTEPFLQIDKCTFKGKYEDSIGTCMIFKEDKDHTRVSYLCKTTKRMRVEQVSIRKKQQTNVPGASQEGQNITDDTTSSDKS